MNKTSFLLVSLLAAGTTLFSTPVIADSTCSGNCTYTATLKNNTSKPINYHFATPWVSAFCENKNGTVAPNNKVVVKCVHIRSKTKNAASYMTAFKHKNQVIGDGAVICDIGQNGSGNVNGAAVRYPDKVTNSRVNTHDCQYTLNVNATEM